MADRPGWDEYFLSIADAVAARADCTRRKVGALIVRNRRIIATGYNGSPAGEPGCLSDRACPRGKHYAATADGYPALFENSGLVSLMVERCGCGNDWPCPEYAKPGSSYDNCVSCHAEENALLYSSRDQHKGAVLYVTDEPCFHCWKLIGASGIERVVFPSGDVKVLSRLRSLHEERSSESTNLR